MPVRKVVTPSGRKIRGYFPSRKMGRMIAFESMLERDAILGMEYSQEVVRFEEQPKQFTYYVNGKPHMYFPDFEMELISGRVIDAEVKPIAKLKKKRRHASTRTSRPRIRSAE